MIRPLREVIEELLADHTTIRLARIEQAREYCEAVDDVLEALEPILEARCIDEGQDGSGFLVSAHIWGLARLALCLALRARGLVTVSRPESGEDYLVPDLEIESDTALDDLIHAVLRTVLGDSELEVSVLTSPVRFGPITGMKIGDVVTFQNVPGRVQVAVPDGEGEDTCGGSGSQS